MIQLPPYTIHPTTNKLNSGDSPSWGYNYLRLDDDSIDNLGHDALVVVIDTAGTIDHPDLVEQNVVDAYNLDFTKEQFPTDGNGHGTHVLGIVAARKNDMGTLGIAPEAYISAMKVLGSGGSGSMDAVAAALEYLRDNPIDILPKGRIINMSLGTSISDSRVTDIIYDLIDQGWIVVCSAGNSGGNLSYPAKINGVISVGSLDQNGRVSSFSSKGDQLDFVAPGSRIYSTWLNNEYRTLSGTSMAAPALAGCLARIMTKYKTYTTKDVWEILRGRTIDLGASGFDTESGGGVFDMTNIFKNTEPGEDITNPRQFDSPEDDDDKGVRPERTFKLTFNEAFTTIWGSVGSSLRPLNFYLDIEVNSTQLSENISKTVLSRLRKFFTNRGFRLPVNSDVQDMAYWIPYFLEFMYQKEHNQAIKVVKIICEQSSNAAVIRTRPTDSPRPTQKRIQAFTYKDSNTTSGSTFPTERETQNILYL